MGSKIVTYIGWGVIAWFVWTNFGSTITSVLSGVGGLAGGLGGTGRAASATSYQPMTAASRNTYFRG
jgi:hypothetical protein